MRSVAHFVSVGVVVADDELDPDSVGSLTVTIAAEELAGWLAAAGVAELAERRWVLVAELRHLAKQLEGGEQPFTVALETAIRRTSP